MGEVQTYFPNFSDFFSVDMMFSLPKYSPRAKTLNKSRVTIVTRGIPLIEVVEAVDFSNGNPEATSLVGSLTR